MKSSIHISILILLSSFLSINLNAQSGHCDNDTPFFNVDLTSSPDSSWFSPNVKRKGECCGETGPPPPRCIEFELTLHEDAVGIIFDIYSGAVPSGAMYYHIDCGPAIQVGEPICLIGSGPFTITFCEPGNNPNVYAIYSIDGGIDARDTATVEGCFSTLQVDGINVSGVQWRDLTGGGTYLSNLSCTADCLDPVFTAPPVGSGIYEIQYEVCGDASASECDGFAIPVCDTLTVSIAPVVSVSISSASDVCLENLILTANTNIDSTSGNYTYAWYDNPNGTGNYLGNTNSITISDVGTYSVVVTEVDYGDCSVDTANMVVSSINGPVSTVLTESVCEGGFFDAGGSSHFTSGVYEYTLQSSNGCDSLVTLNLTVNPKDTTNSTATTCDANLSGVTTQLLSNLNGCDSLVITTVVLLSKDTTYLTATTCDANLSGVTTELLSNTGWL